MAKVSAWLGQKKVVYILVKTITSFSMWSFDGNLIFIVEDLYLF